MNTIKHLGNITEIDGAVIEKVDCITFGAPCQDLSVAGKRKGMKSILNGDEENTRSGLFFEAIRLIKEMREDDKRNGRTGINIRPNWAVYENVVGAFSSNKGADFQAVLTEIVRIAEPDAPDVPMPEKGKWGKAGELHDEMGRWSVAWRTHDAQYWGVPQRRKRISVVADFSGGGAAKVLFDEYIGAEPEPEVQPVTESLSRNFGQGEKERKETAGDVRNGFDGAIGGAISFQERAGKPGGGKGILIQNERTGALSTLNNQSVFGIPSYNSNVMKSANPNSGYVEEDSARTLDGNGASPDHYQGGTAIVYRKQGHPQNAEQPQKWEQTETADTLNVSDNSDARTPILIKQEVFENHAQDLRFRPLGETCSTLATNLGTGGNNQPLVVNSSGDDVSGTLDASYYKGCGERQNVEREVVCARTQDKILRILQEAYGTEKVLKWGTDVLASLQQTDLLQQGVYESGIQGETQSWNELDDSTLPCPTDIAKWLLRDLREQQECGCSPQGRQSAEQSEGESAKAMQKLSYQSTPSAKEMLNMWAKGEGIGLLREALSAIQEMGKSIGCRRENRTIPVVRRLTPMEAERLQGFPDNYTNIGEWVDSKGKKHKEADSPRYKALGNSIALPFWFWLLRRISATYSRRATLGSLFDGIGGFPYVWEMCNGKGTARWASEIEEFAIAVTKKHFPESEET